MNSLIPLTITAAVLSACTDIPDLDAAQAPAQIAAAPAAASPLEPGLWETSTYDEAEGGDPDVSRICIGADEQGAPKDLLANLDDPTCKTSRAGTTANMTAHSECLRGGVRLITDAAWSAQRTTYTFELKTRAVMPNGQAHEGRVTAAGHRLGPCPAGMEPGDSDAE